MELHHFRRGGWELAGHLERDRDPGDISGAALFEPTFQGISIEAPGIFVNSYTSAGLAQSIPTPDGSYFSTPSAGSVPITGYYTYAGSSGPDSFGLLITTAYPTRSGDLLLYTAGTQSVVIPIAFSDFNPGTYQFSDNATFTTPLTVNLTVEAAPEPGTLALSAVAVFSAGLVRRSVARRRK